MPTIDDKSRKINDTELPYQMRRGITAFETMDAVIRAAQGNFDHLMGTIRDTSRGHNTLVDDVAALRDAVNGILDATGSGSEAAAVDFVGARISRSNSQTITTSTETNISFDTKDIDTSDFVDISGQPTRITVPSGLGGTYQFYCNARWAASATGYRYIALKKNATTYMTIIEANNDGAGSPRLGMEATSGPISLVGGDFMTVEVWQNTGGNLAINDNNAADPWMSCIRLGD